jgi:hypothetical protein
MIYDYYLKRHKFNVLRDYEEQKVKHLLYEFKKKTLMTNGFTEKVEYLENYSAKFFKINVDEDLIEEAVDVDDVYPVSVEDEMTEIKKTAGNFSFLRDTLNTYDYCRTRCLISNQSHRNFVVFPRENQMCFSDCMNVRTELFKEKNGEDRTFVWLA